MVIDLFNLKYALKLLDVEKVEGDLNHIIRDISYDSRTVGPGNVFVAIKGHEKDGHDFIKDAIDRGAVCVITESWQDLSPEITQIMVADSRLALAVLSSLRFDNPTSRLKIVGITGTNGKTTTAYLVRSILDAEKIKSGLIGTIEYRLGKKRLAAGRTTPESYDLQKLFSEMLGEGLSHATIEVSSHAVDLKRTHGIEFDVTVFTNLTQDHLDYHGDMESYSMAKRKFFKKNPASIKVINIDDDFGKRLAKDFDNVMTFGLNEPADIRGHDMVLNGDGTSFRLSFNGGEIDINLKLNGLFNVSNALASFGAGIALGLDPKNIKAGIEALDSVPGRFERVDLGQSFGVYVDYAHTPDGLEKLIKNAREITAGQVIVVFGCGGDRDRKKRPLMGRIAAEMADLAIITSDNPRSEEPEAIISEILKGAKGAGSNNFLVVPDRRKAIGLAIREAYGGDVVLIAGKGHETGQTFKGKTIPFIDREVAFEFLKEVV
ncbi:MAG: UDP-N-acetylmuramoyl-L-alanyl-D-glutamate--2,6-diaminopimelate ligase [Actinomycetota bacterium]|nr:UDP-N-acetylmuramoyl-L-alanyl-D-glutamate--2,6-diaminopimelate ligase [Actinomycetota bacterium]